MLNLNLKLQSTVLKSQVKAIDLELRELEAEQAAAHLAIVKVCSEAAEFHTGSLTDLYLRSRTCSPRSSKPIRTRSRRCSSSTVSPAKLRCSPITSSRSTTSGRR